MARNALSEKESVDLIREGGKGRNAQSWFGKPKTSDATRKHRSMVLANVARLSLAQSGASSVGPHENAGRQMTALDQLLLAHRRKAEAPAWGLIAVLVWENLPGTGQP